MMERNLPATTSASVPTTANPSSESEPALSWYTKDLMVEETVSPTLSLSSSPVSSPTLLAPGSRINPPTVTVEASAGPVFSLPLPRARVASTSALLSVPSEDEPKHRAGRVALRQPKRRRSISDSLVPAGSKAAKIEADDEDEDELNVEDLSANEDEREQGADVEDEASEDVEESGEEDDDHADDQDVDSSPRARQGGLQGHESGPPSPPAGHLQHGMIENPDGTAFYHCKFCQQTWPQSHFRNAQQFGAHCSNCSRKRKVKDPQDMTTTTRERNRRMRNIKRSRSSSASKASFDETRHKLIDSEDSSGESQDAPSPTRKYRHTPANRPKRISRVLPRRSSPAAENDGMERFFSDIVRDEVGSESPKTKNIYALLAYVKSELARLREQEDTEELELTAREMVQDARTEWSSRIQELRVDAMSDLRAHTAALPRRAERLAALHPGHPATGTRNSIDYILNNSANAESAPAWTFPTDGSARHTAVPAAPPPSPLAAARHQLGSSSTIPSAPITVRTSCVPLSTSPLARASPLPTLM